MAPTSSDSPRKLTLGERPIPYTLKRSRRRTIGLAIDHRGLRVTAPLKARISDIESLLKNHQSWVIEKLDQWLNKPPAIALTPVVADGMQFPFLGEMWTLKLLEASKTLVHWSDSTLCLTLHYKPNSTPEKALTAALTSRAREYFAQRITSHVVDAAQRSPALILTPPPLALSTARTRWGSCSQRCLRLNRHLIHLPPKLVDYVVAHELAHLVEMNHSPRFWAVVEQLHPNWRESRQQLRQEGRQCPRF